MQTQEPQTTNQEKVTDNGFRLQSPSISLPKGGGAIRGIGEKFAANPVTGTGSMSVPIATSPGRSGFGPELSLSYDSGAGNGPFGFGWSLSLPSITRKIDKGLPQYHDAEESDVYILSGAEDLVPVLLPDGKRFEDNVTAPGYMIHRYRPRIEGLFARIERWTNITTKEIHWRSISRDNVTTVYGKDNNSRIFNPVDLTSPAHRFDPTDPDAFKPTHIFSWLICQSYDDKGNSIIYSYQCEDSHRIFEDERDQIVTKAHERNRDHVARSTNRYLKRIKYGNRTPNRNAITWQVIDPSQLPSDTWMFEVVFDYDEGHLFNEKTHDVQRTFVETSPNSDKVWTCRPDPFSTYRAGFEVRTYRLCQRVLMFHHFPGEDGVGKDCLVRSTDFTYSHKQAPTSARNPVYTFLQKVTQSGYTREGSRYLKRSLPPVEFEYTQPAVQDMVEEVDAESLENLPIGLDGTTYQWTDLHGEGISGILTEQGGAWFYKRNLSPLNEIPENGTTRTKAKFAPLEVVAVEPNLALAEGAQFMDLAGDGQPDLVILDGPLPGLYEHDGDEGWQPFRPFMSRLNRDTRDPNLKFVDLNGDGHADVLITEDESLVWHASLSEAGFGPAFRVHQALDEEKGPRLVFADGTQSIYLSDMSGDGLTDLARIRNGEVCYWPNLGYGRFGAKITMDHAPHFDNPDQFDQKRIRLADIDGTGTTDIIYLHRDGVRLYFNQSGNSWSEPHILKVFPRVDDFVSITPIDLLGNGTACLVWSSTLPDDARRPMRYVNLMGSQKPHLLTKVVNNLGAETQVYYAPSTYFYLADKQAGKPWITRLPFPVHVVERVETYDHISRNRFVTRYAYHHGYFDREEREFRGFGMVEQWDTEEFAALKFDDRLPEATNLHPAFRVPSAHTKSWFHTGVYLDREHISRQFEDEYYREPGLNDEEFRALLLPDTTLPDDDLILEEEREACRALKGMMLRQEVYADDAGPDASEPVIQRAGTPYTVLEQDFTIRTLQPRDGNRHAVFFTHPHEVITYHYERNPTDPRIQHALTLEVDNFGNVLKEAAIGYGRREMIREVDDEGKVIEKENPAKLELDSNDWQKQTGTLITYSENLVTNRIDDTDNYRVPLPCETRTYELTGYTPTGASGRFQNADFVQPDPVDPDGVRLVHIFDSEIQYEEQPTSGRQRRLIEHIYTLYRQNNLTTLSPLGEVESLALPGESYKLALTHGLLTHVLKRKRTGQTVEELLLDTDSVSRLEGKSSDGGGYVTSGGNWWIPSGRIFFDPDADIDNPATTAAQEQGTAREHFYQPRKFADPFNHSTVVGYDAHDLLVTRTHDALDNTVIAVNDYRVLQPRLVMDPNRNRTEVAFDALGMVVGTAIMGKPGENLGDSLDGFNADLSETETLDHLTNPLTDPAAILGRATTRLVYDLFAYQRTKDQPDPQPAVVYTLARETHDADLRLGEQTKVQHSFSYSDGFGREIQKKIQAEPEKLNGVVGPPRWVGSGWTIFNNKGKPVRQYEPFFSDLPPEDGHRFEFGVQVGVSSVLFYDPLERVVATLHPNDSYEKVIFDPWQQTTWDVNDTVAARDRETGDPRTDPHISGYVKEYFKSQPANWQTWYQSRMAGQDHNEKTAAEKAAKYTNTPTIAHFDSLGRPFLTHAHNRYEQNGTTVDEQYATRVELDIEGNEREVSDALGRIVMQYDYDMLSNVIHQHSMEAGERWMLNDVVGNPIRAWDSRRFVRRMTYDPLRRPTGLYVNENGTERLAERTVYGETLDATASDNNHRTRVYQVCDGAGVLTNVQYDFKGNLLESKRELLPDYQNAVDWDLNPNPNDGSYATTTTYDALNRPVSITTPDKSVYRATFNEANLLDKVDVNLRGATATTPFVTNIDYDAKGQRKKIEYGNSAQTTYDYDDFTFRLTHLKTTRPAGLNGLAPIFADATVVQDLHYTYDPVGNITRIEDRALNTVFHNNQQVEPINDYTYDAIYRLIEAKGREHIGQNEFDFEPPNGNYRDHPFAGLNAHPNDLQALHNYTQCYEYDAVGNFTWVHHIAGHRRWTRGYWYEEDSLIESDIKSNRLTRTRTRKDASRIESYTHDEHGNMTSMPHLHTMGWDFEDQLQATTQQVVNGGTGETTYYVYDAGGQRVRKVTENQNGKKVKERIYLGGYEIYREYSGGNQQPQLERETLHIMDDKQRIVLVETQTIKKGKHINEPVPLQRYQLGNHLGSASVELAQDAAMISYEEYHPYGTTAFQAHNTAAEVSLKRYRYTGKERDEESGLYYHGARYYASWLGRWISADPAGLLDGPNLFAYTTDRPVNMKDPTGFETYQTGPLEIVETLPEGGTVTRREGPNLNRGGLEKIEIKFDLTDQQVIEGHSRQLEQTLPDLEPIPPSLEPIPVDGKHTRETVPAKLEDRHREMLDWASQIVFGARNFEWDYIDVGTNVGGRIGGFEVDIRGYVRFTGKGEFSEFHSEGNVKARGLGAKIRRHDRIGSESSLYASVDVEFMGDVIGVSAGFGQRYNSDWNPDRWKSRGSYYRESPILRVFAEAQRILFYHSELRGSLKFKQGSARINYNYRMRALGERQVEIEVMSKKGGYLRGIKVLRSKYNDSDAVKGTGHYTRG